MLGHVAGCVLLLAAPGNFVRANALPSGPFSDHVAGVIGNLGSLFDVWWIPAMALVALSLMYGGSVREPAGSNAQPDCSGRRGIWDILRAGHGWIFLVLALVYMLILLALPRPTLAARVSFPASIFLICYLAALFFQRPVTNRDNRIGVPVLLVLLACHLAIVVPDLRDLAQIHRGWANDPQFKKGPGTDVTLPPVLLNGRPASHARTCSSRDRPPIRPISSMCAQLRRCTCGQCASDNTNTRRNRTTGRCEVPR